MQLPFDYAVRNLGRSQMRLAISVGGSMLVALLALASVGFVRGMSQALGRSGLTHNVIVLGAGSEESIERSEISPQVSTLLAAEVSGIATMLGAPLLSPEVHVALPLDAGTGAPVVAVFRGVTASAFLVHPQVRLIEGRAPEPGTDEVILGREALAMIRRAGLGDGIGSNVMLEHRSLPIVGVFAAPGTVMEGEIWMPLQSLKVATQRTTDSCVITTMVSDDTGEVDAFAAIRIDLELASMRESEYYAALNRFLAPIRWLVIATALVVSIGGLLGGIITFDAAFASRVRELATLQTLGFRRRAIGLSLVTEAVLAAVSGGLLAAVAGMLLLDGVSVRSSMGSFAVRVDTFAVAAALLVTLALGVIGALIPAWRCLRLSIPDALRSSA
ncbi:MAG: ABC transporter permease [Phycisphaerae bacterium]|nr:ABC transporter permease [Phycisphaerae bacterium]